MSNMRDNYPALRYIDDYEKDNSEECKRCKGECGYIGIIGEWACQGFVPMTNADRIRAMSDEEIADKLFSEVCSLIPLEYCRKFENCHDCVHEWLKQEVSE